MNKFFWAFWRSLQILRGLKTAAQKGLIGLSADDGPDLAMAFQMLAVIKKYQVSMTFCWFSDATAKAAGTEYERFYELLTMIDQTKSEIVFHGLHDFEPDRVTTYFGYPRSFAAFRQGVETLQVATGMPVVGYRPHTKQIGSTPLFAWKMGLPVILGDLQNVPDPQALDSEDEQLKTALRVQPGHTLVLHESRLNGKYPGRIATPRVLARLLPTQQANGFRYTKVSGLFT